VIDAAIAELAPIVGVRAGCAAVGEAQARWYRRHRQSPPPAKPERVPAPQPRALSEIERKELRAVLNSEEFVDEAPATVYAKLLDQGIYRASVPTMYRVLREHDEVRERRRHATHPAAKKPELLATQPNECWSWDITKLLGPQNWTYYYLYVIIDVRHEAPSDRVGWKDPPAACRSRSLKLGAARSWECRRRWERPR
jgi:putative transposase